MKILKNRRLQACADPRKGGWVQVGLMALSYGISMIVGKMMAKKNKSPLQSDKPTTLVTRGSYIPWWVGIRVIGPVLTWAGEREIRKEKAEGGGKGGGSSSQQDIYYESGWQILGVGPVRALHSISQGGSIIMSGPITSESHPSGSTVDLGKEGTFTIYWGESSQPVNTFLGDADRVTVSSRWPGACYIVWNKKRLGGQPRWPVLEYVMERHPSTSVLTQSQGWYDPVQTATGNTFNVISAFASATPLSGWLEFEKDKTSTFKPDHAVELTGTGIPDGLYNILKSEIVITVTPVAPPGFDIEVATTRVFLEEGTLGVTGTGTAETYENDLSDGANVAHVVAELLYADYPLGLGLDPDHLVEKWDLDSLEAWGVEAETDGWRAGVLGTEGDKAEAILAGMMQDHGVLLPIDTSSGKLKFQRVREPSGTIPSISSSLFADSLPEIETIHGEMPVDKLMYAFNDRAQGFSDMTIVVDDDGQASFAEYQRSRKVALTSTVHFPTAALLAELRSPEELAQAGEFRVTASREARDLLPGEPLLVDTFDEVLRVTSVKVDPISEKVKLKLIPDFYGVPKSTFEVGEGLPPSTLKDPEQDLQFKWLEVPEQVLGAFPSTQNVLAARIRAHDQISFSSLWISRDGSSYTLFGNDSFVQTGGTLDDALDADGPSFVALGPGYTELGPDNGTLTQDLSVDLTNWGAGRQLCVIVSSAGTEICFLQKATITGGSTRRLDGLLRARYDTRKLAHPIGAEVYIFDVDAITPIADVLLSPAENLYLKSQPGTSAGQVNLSAVVGYPNIQVGKGQVPIAPDYVYVRAPYKNNPAFLTGDDITVSWALSSGPVGTGAGQQSAGTAIANPDIPGTVQIEFLTAGDVVQLTRSVEALIPQNTITNAELVAAFGAEPSSFKVRVTHVANGQASPASPSLTITKL